MVPADNHVHSQWSYDTDDDASMADACERALAAGLPSIAFTEHLDFTDWTDDDPIAAAPLELLHRSRIHPLDVTGYLACVEECRARFPDLRVLSGVEVGEAHLFAASARAVVAGHPFDRVLGSLHGVPCGGRLSPLPTALRSLPAHQVTVDYFGELLRLVEGSDLFEVLAHADFPRRYWPTGHGPEAVPYRERDFEDQYRAVLRALAASGRVLEINTRSPLMSVDPLRWWREEGGRAVSFGSDAHQSWRVGEKFKLAADIAEAAGFRPGRDRFGFWRR